MNKRLKIITAFLLTLAMAVTGSYAFAGTDMQQADGEDQAALEMTEETTPQDGAQEATEVAEENVPQEINAVTQEEQAQAEESSQDLTQNSEVESVLMTEEEGAVSLMGLQTEQTIRATTVNYSSPSNLNLSWKQCYYKHTVDEHTGEKYCYPIAVKVENSGKLWVKVKGSSGNTENADIFVGKLNTNTTPYTIDYSYLNKGSMTAGDGTTVIDLKDIDVTYGETYYIGIESPQDGNFSIRAHVYPYGLRTLKENTYMMASGYKGSYNDSNAVFRIYPSKTGYIRVYLKAYGAYKSAGYVTLLNYKKYTRSEKLWYYEGSDTSYIVFGVKKGNTYYLKVSGCAGDGDHQYVYGIKYTNYSATSRTNTTKSKAKKLTRQASYISTAVPATGSSGNQWYKFKVTKKRATKIKIDASNIKSGTTKVTVYCGKKKIGTSTLSNGRINTFSITYGTTYGKAKKGTYYVKVHKSGYASGAYKIRYVK